MLRTAFVLALIAFGIRHALRGPFYALLFYLWIAYFRPQEWVWSDWLHNLNLSLIVGAYVIVIAVATGKAFRLNARLFLLILFLTQSLVATVASPYSDYAWPYWTDFLKSTAMTYLIAVLVTDVQKLRLVCLTIVLSLGFEAAKQGWVQLILLPGEKNYNDVAFLGDNNAVAVGMFMLVPLIIALFQTSTKRWARRSYVFLALGVVYRGVSTYSRGGFLTFGVMVAQYVLHARRKLLAVATVVILAVALGQVMTDAFWTRMNSIRFARTSLVENATEVPVDEGSILGRLHFWHVATLMVQDRPLVGVGHNSYVAAYNSYDDSNGAFGRSRSVHSMWLGILSEHGYPGLVLFILLFGTSLATCWRIRWRAKRESRLAELVPYVTAVETALLACAVGGAFVILQYTEMLWHFMGLTIALNRLALAPAAEPARTQGARVLTPTRVATRGLAG